MRLSSPFLFNLFYYDLIEMLASHEGGISIGDETFNMFAYLIVGKYDSFWVAKIN